MCIKLYGKHDRVPLKVQQMRSDHIRIWTRRNTNNVKVLIVYMVHGVNRVMAKGRNREEFALTTFNERATDVILIHKSVNWAVQSVDVVKGNKYVYSIFTSERLFLFYIIKPTSYANEKSHKHTAIRSRNVPIRSMGKKIIRNTRILGLCINTI